MMIYAAFQVAGDGINQLHPSLGGASDLLSSGNRGDSGVGGRAGSEVDGGGSGRQRIDCSRDRDSVSSLPSTLAAYIREEHEQSAEGSAV